MTSDPPKKTPRLSYRSYSLFALASALLLVGGSVTWAHYSKIAGAVIATGTVVVEGKPKSIQHLDGGIVKDILVSPGQPVEENAVLLRLDDTTIKANLSIYERRLREALVRRQRLMSELEGASHINVPEQEISTLELGDVTAAVEQQRAMLKARRLTRETQEQQFDEKIAQFENQILGVEALRAEKTLQMAAFEEELGAVGQLVDKGLTAKSRLLALQRSMADMRGQIAEHVAEAARLRNSIAETRIAKLQISTKFREEVFAELEKAESQIDELTQQLLATRSQVQRVDLRAPVSGVIHELSVFTIGGVIQAGQTVMQIIPKTETHEFELNVDTRSIDQIAANQKVIIRFPAFHQRTTPELEGKVKSFSPNSIVDEKSGFAFYRVTVDIADDQLAKLKGNQLVPGMPLEGMFPTTERSVLSYLLKPMSDHLNRAMREE